MRELADSGEEFDDEFAVRRIPPHKTEILGAAFYILANRADRAKYQEMGCSFWMLVGLAPEVWS